MSLEIMFTSNTDPNPALKDKIDKVIKSWEEIGVVSKHLTFSFFRLAGCGLKEAKERQSKK